MSLNQQTMAFIDGLRSSGKGMDCPCCGRYAQVYYRGINKTVAKQLMTLWALQESPTGYVHVAKLVLGASGAGDFTKAKYFGLIEEKPHQPDAKKTSGQWRLTQKGRLFVMGQTTIPRRAAVYNDVVLGYSDGQIHFHDALGEPFNYSAMMGEGEPA